jgi:hypothetical protein
MIEVIPVYKTNIRLKCDEKAEQLSTEGPQE